MASHHHRQQHRPLRLSLPPSARLSPPSPFPFSPSSLSTPSKLRRHTFSSSSSSSQSSASYSSLLFLLFSLRSLYSLLPFLRSSPPSSLFSLFPFSFLVSLLSFSLYTLFNKPFSLLLSPPLTLKPYLPSLAAKSSLLALSLLLRFQALRSCGTAATILADLSGSLLASSLPRLRRRHIAGLLSLALALLALSNSWHRAGCSPLSPPASSDDDRGCSRILPMLLPFLSGFLAHFEKASSSRGSLRQLGRKRVRSLSLGFATVMLFFPALISFLMADVGGEDKDSSAVSVWSLGWPLFNAVLFGVLLNDNFGDEKVVFSAKDFRREFVVTFFCTLVLEMFYFPKLSLPGFLFCGLLLWVSVRELGSLSLDYLEIGSSEPSESLYSMVVKPVRHILSERKSRKIAAFLLINAGYMVVEFVAGFMSNSLGLISDACHMLFDCAALAIGLYASYISRLPADHQYNYGRGRTEVLSGYVNAVFLVLVGALIVLESFERILDPQEISTNSLLAVSLGGLVVNLVGLVFFHDEHHHAHGGGGTCSHSHTHSHSHSHGHSSIDHDHGPTAEHHQCVEFSEESFNGHSHADHDQQHSCGSHNDHHHDMDKQYNNSNFGRKEGNHDHHCHGHGHDHHCHDQEHDLQDHPHEGEVHVHQYPMKPERDLQRLHTSPGNSHSHHHEGYKQNHCHGDKGNCCNKEIVNPNEMQDHSHVPSSQSKKLSTHKDSGKHHHIDHNMEGIFLHVLADTLGSVGVVISTLLIKYKGWLVADPACSIFISGMIVVSVIPLLRNSAEILLQRIPRAHERDLKVVVDKVLRIKGVCGVQKLNVWNFTNTDIVGTLHLHVSAETDKASVKNRASGLLQEAGIKDITIQVECVKG